MALLSGKAAEDWLAAHPTYNYTSYSPGANASQVQGKAADYGILDKLAAGIASPVRNLYTGIAEQTAQATQKAHGIKDYTPQYMSQAEWQDYVENPLLKNIQNVVGAGSLFIPGAGAGGSIGKTLLTGAATGAASSFGSANTNKLAKGDIGEVLGGTLLGAATGGALHTAGKVAGKLTGKLGRAAQTIEEVTPGVSRSLDIRAGRLGLNASDFGSPSAAKSIGRTVIKELDDLGLKTGTKGQIADSIGSALSERGAQIKQLLADSGEVVDTNKIIGKFESAFKNNPKLLDKATSKEILGMVADLGDNPSYTKLHEFRQALDSMLPDKAFSGATEGLADKTRIIKTMRDIVSSDLKDNPNFGPELKSLLQKESALIQARPTLLKAVDKGGTKISSALLGGVKLPVGGVTERLQDIAGKVAGGSMPSIPGASTAANLLQSAASVAEPVLSRPAVQYQLGSQLFGQQTAPQAEAAGLPSMEQMPGEQTTSQGEFNPQTFAMQAIMAGYTPEEVQSFQDMLGLGGGSSSGSKLPAAQVKQIADTQTSLQQLDDLEVAIKENSSRFGPIQGGALGDIFEPLDPARSAIKSRINTLAQKIGVALEGGKLTDADIQRYRQMLPTLTDTPDQALQKLQVARELISGQLQGMQAGYQEAGYNI